MYVFSYLADSSQDNTGIVFRKQRKICSANCAVAQYLPSMAVTEPSTSFRVRVRVSSLQTLNFPNVKYCFAQIRHHEYLQYSWGQSQFNVFAFHVRRYNMQIISPMIAAFSNYIMATPIDANQASAFIQCRDW